MTGNLFTVYWFLRTTLNILECFTNSLPIKSYLFFSKIDKYNLFQIPKLEKSAFFALLFTTLPKERVVVVCRFDWSHVHFNGSIPFGNEVIEFPQSRLTVMRSDNVCGGPAKIL